MRFEGRISEQSAERSVRRPLTLMNSAPHGCMGQARSTRKENAGTRPASGIKEEEAWRTTGEVAILREATDPQDPAVPLEIRRMSLTMERLLWLSEFNAVIDIRCSESTNRATQHESALYSQSISLARVLPLFTRVMFDFFNDDATNV
jgi:hypothetical protein